MAIEANTPVPIVNGWKLAKDLQKGDYVFSHQGNPIQIELVQPYTVKKGYEVLLNDGISVLVDNHALFPVSDINRRWVENHSLGLRKPKAKQKFINPEQLLENGLTTVRGDRIYSINNCQPIQFLWEDHPVPPFIVGMWMTRRNPQAKFNLRDENVQYIKRRIRECGWSFVENSNNRIQVRPSINHAFITKYPRVPKVLPIEYCFGSIEQRLELLQGFLALRPNCFNKKRKAFEVHSEDLRFLVQIQGICESLGMKTQIFCFDNTFSHKLRFKTDFALVPWQELNVNSKNISRRMIVDVKPTKKLDCVHIQTPQPFVVGQGFLPVWH